jgi:uncharacterized protein
MRRPYNNDHIASLHPLLRMLQNALNSSLRAFDFLTIALLLSILFSVFLNTPNFESPEAIGVPMKPAKSGAELKIRISQLSNGLHEYHLKARTAEIGLDSNFGPDVEVDAVLDKTARQLNLRAEVKSSGVFQCDRCLEDFSQPLSSRYNMLYVFDELESSRYPPDEVQVIGVDTSSIDLAEDVRQVVVLSVPLKLLCKEDCKGLCPRCGTNRNFNTCDCSVETDNPQWRGLEGLLNH